ncbi:MAG: selenocysteine-specific translation elongation factor [Armatimonadetes bacterium]|nr:selenocysteine-specific translation elongation factor [Armatimonadota bacterium]
MACLIGTAGHVDHGKSSLIRALTGIDPDRLPEEKERGMTIDLGFACVDLPTAGRVSIIDVPGHERYATNMLAGTMNIDIALLCIAADEGIMPQTEEHLKILDLLPVQTLIVAVTKADVVDTDFLVMQIEHIEEDLSRTRFRGAAIIPVSSQTGEGLPVLIASLDHAVAAFKPTPDPNDRWYMPIDRAFLVKGHGLVVTGSVARGHVETGTDAEIYPEGHKVKIRSIHVHDATVDTAERGMRTALNISGVSSDDVHRGMVISAPKAVVETFQSDFKVRWVDEPKHGMEVRAAVGSADVLGKLYLNDQDSSIAFVRFTEKIAVAKGEPAILRRHSPPTLLAGGVVITPEAESRRKKDSIRYIDLVNIDEGIIAAIHEAPNGVTTQEICRLIGVSEQQLGDHFEQLIRERRVIGFAGLWYQPPVFLAQANLFLKALREIHAENPLSLNHPREVVLKRSGHTWFGKPFERILTKLAELKKIEIDGTRIKLAEFKIAMNPKQEAFLQRVEAELDKIVINVPYASEIASKLGVPVQAVEEILNTAANADRIVKVGQTLYYTSAQIERVKSILKEGTKGQPFTAPEAKEALQTSRKFLIPMLEYLDSVGFTTRIDDKRVIRDR